jgi:hypothetical protein
VEVEPSGSGRGPLWANRPGMFSVQSQEKDSDNETIPASDLDAYSYELWNPSGQPGAYRAGALASIVPVLARRLD